MATNGFMQSNGLDAAVIGTGGIALPTMIDSTQTLFVAPVTKSTQNGFNFTTGNTPVTSMPIIVGNSGYVTTADNAALEPGSNFSIAATGYLDTSSPVATGNTIKNGTGVATGSPITLAAGANTITSTAPTLTGSTVVNGTGAATGSPITLIGGLNTITISTLGTFTVTLGTGLSGYATSGASCLVTGSPLTLSAGSNTITTTGSTGTFTINIYGTFILTLQSGISGTATSSAATVVGSPVSLVQGTNTIMTSTVGTFTVTLNETKNIVSKTGALQVNVDPSVSGTIDTSVNGNTFNVIQQFSTTTNADGIDIGGTYWAYQTFTATAGTINGLGIYVYSTIGSQSTTTFALYATSAGLPTGSALTSGTIASVTQSAWNTVSCSSYTLAGGTVYAIVVKMPAGAYGTNYLLWSNAAGSGAGYSINSGSTYTSAGAYTFSYETLASLPQITGVSSGVGTLSLSETVASGGTLTLSWTPSGGSANTSTSTNAGSIADTANNWIIDQNNVMPYMTSYTYTVGGTEKIKYQPNTIVITTALVNLDSAGAYPGVITFGSNPAGIAVAIGPLTTVSSGSSVSGGSSGSSSYAPASSGSQTNAEQLPALNAITFPLEPVVHGFATIVTASNPSNEPATELMMVRIFAGIIVVGGAIGSLFLIRGHLFIAGVAGLVLMGIWIAWHVYPLASISIAVIFLIGTVLADRGGSD